MGTSAYKNDEENIDKKKRINERKFKQNSIYETNLYINKISRSICKIKIKNRTGTGFLIRLYTDNNPMFFLMTNEHVVKKSSIKKKEIIEVFYDCGFKFINIRLDKNERIINEYKNDYNLDITIIEIIKEDNINEDYFLLPYLKSNKIKIDDNICIPQYSNNLNYAKGIIKNINIYELSYNASIKSGSSGSPIILENTIEVLGIHKQGGNEANYGVLIYPILNIFKNSYAAKIIYENGEYYMGQWKNGLKHGKGKIYYKNGNIKYDGDFINDKIEGNGKYIDEDGKYFIGQWKNGVPHGKGKIYYKNGNIKYDGDFINRKYEGNGKYIYENGEYYIGQWKNGLKHGKRILYYKNVNIKYDGDFINDKFEGNGKSFYENGEYYIGQWKNGVHM